MNLKKGPVDLWLLTAVVVLFGIGLIMVFSASSAYSYNNYSDPYYVIKKQAQWAIIGIIALAAAIKVPVDWLKRLTPALMLLALGLLVAVIAGLGTEVNGSTAWIDFKIGRFQPTELAKLALVLYLSRTLSTNIASVRSFKDGLASNLFVPVIAAALIMKQPDLGGLLIIAGTVFVMLIIAGSRLDHLSLMAGLSGLLGFIYVYNSKLRWERVQVFWNPWTDPDGKGFQPIQALLALGSGGLNGVGLGKSSQKLFHLPEQHTDFIFAILGEELGFIGAFTVILLFGVIAWRGYRAAMRSSDLYISFLAAGLTTMLVLQAIVNIAVVVGLMPVTGVTLPFVSYGGSSLLFSMLGVGLLLNVTRYLPSGAENQ